MASPASLQAFPKLNQDAIHKRKKVVEIPFCVHRGADKAMLTIDFDEHHVLQQCALTFVMFHPELVAKGLPKSRPYFTLGNVTKQIVHSGLSYHRIRFVVTQLLPGCLKNLPRRDRAAVRSVVPQRPNPFPKRNYLGIDKNTVQLRILRLQSVKEAFVGCSNILLSHSKLEAVIYKQCDLVEAAVNQRVVKIQVVAYFEGELLTLPLAASSGQFLYLVKS